LNLNGIRFPYKELHDGPSIVWHRGSVVLPQELPILNVDNLPVQMRLIVDMAISIYTRWLISTTVIDDEQPRLLLVFKANIPEKTVTLRLNLGKLSKELDNGLSPGLLEQALRNILKN
jgi:hypothetical protein